MYVRMYVCIPSNTKFKYMKYVMGRYLPFYCLSLQSPVSLSCYID